MATRTSLLFATLILAAPASAQTIGAPLPYAPTYADGYGFAGEFVRGDYIGAPLTAVPSPTRIASAPTARPTLTVIQGTGPKGRQRLGAVAEGQTAGAQVISVRVPRR
jgi:hypothetical protein